MNNYLIKYLIDNAENDLAKKYIDFFKIELDWHIYNGDNHVSKTYYRNRKIGVKESIIKLIQYSSAILSQSNSKQSGKLDILSTIYSPIQRSLSETGYNLFSPVWTAVGKKNIFGDLETVRWHKKIQDLIRNEDFHLYLDSKLHGELEEFQHHLVLEYQKQDFRALMLSTDQHFYSKYSIDIFKKLERPSFVFSHGLPGIYSKSVDNRSDYLMVWGEKIKQNYLLAGFDGSKIKVVGHPQYKKLPKVQELRSDLSDVLVIPVSSSIYHQHTYDDVVFTDKSMAVLYLYQVQSVLQKLGIKRAMYRVHPAINKKWIHSFLDHDFYVPDTESLSNSLNRASLIVGATSTVLLEALIHGVNYIVYEPTDADGINLLNFKNVPPFDGSESKLPIANNEQELEAMLKFNTMTDYSLVQDYIQDLDLTILKELIK